MSIHIIFSDLKDFFMCMMCGMHISGYHIMRSLCALNSGNF